MNLEPKTFFEAIATADSERIHSETIAWIYGIDNSILSDEEKSRSLNLLSGINQDSVYSNFQIVTEEDNVDILIKTDQIIFAIENKLKSSEHKAGSGETWQTEYYLQHLKKKYRDLPISAIYLTLIGERASDEKWVNKTYKDLHEALSILKFSINSKEQIISQDYLVTIGRLANVYDEFIANYPTFKNVFGTKHIKGNELDNSISMEERHILNLGLQTIFTKAFMWMIFYSANLKKRNVSISESHGYGRMYYEIKDYLDRNYSVLQDKDQNDIPNMQFAFVIQRDTFKVGLLHKSYGSSNPERLTKNFKDRFFECFRIWNSSLSNWDKYVSTSKPCKQNKPKKDIQPRVSVSFKLKKPLHEIPKQDLVSLVKDSIRTAEDLIEKFLT
ncbi:MAG: PD-(D/E)XK nuclease family protein [Bacteroidota bacterium]